MTTSGNASARERPLDTVYSRPCASRIAFAGALARHAALAAFGRPA